MSTIHLFDALNNTPSSLGTLEKTTNIQHLFQIPVDDRNEIWNKDMLANIDECRLTISEHQVIFADDGFPYISLVTDLSDNEQPFIIKQELNKLIEQGYGVVINAKEKRSDWLFTFGDLINLKLNNEFYTEDSLFSSTGEPFMISQDEKVLVGQPSEQILPTVVRKHIREFLAHSNINQAKVMLIARNYEDENTLSQDLVFNLLPDQFATDNDYRKTMTGIAWFLPRHYSIAGVDENMIQSGFQKI